MGRALGPSIATEQATLPRMSVVRAVRGATTVATDTEAEIRAACCELFGAIIEENQIRNEDLISVLVTVTADLHSMFPARAIREECGLDDVPLLGALEAEIDNGLQRAIRVLVHVNTDRSRSEIRHVFQQGAAALRPDIATS